MLRIQRFSFLSEVFPVVLVGTLLNIVGRNACQYAQNHHVEFASQLFLDMIGTAFSAILLGPWWGALVGIFSAMVNGNFYDNYFPFGIVNVCGGLSWGYVAAALGARERLAQGSPSGRNFLICFVALFLSGALACGLASFAVEAILYPPMGRPFVRGYWYEATRQWLESFNPRFATDTAVLFWGAMTREFIDKTVTLLIALICVTVYFVPRQDTQEKPLHRLMVDAASILGFICIYGVYLCFGRLFKPTILFAGGIHPVAWLSYPPIIALLYFPIVLAFPIFCFGTLDQDGAYGRRVEALRLRRKFLLTTYLSAKPWQFFQTEIGEHFAAAKKLYGLMAGVLTWPVTKFVGTQGIDIGLLYTGGAAGLIAYYFYQNRQVVEGCRRLYLNMRGLEDWFSTQHPPNTENSASLIAQFVRYVSGTASAMFHDPSFIYVVVETTRIVEARAGGQASGRPSTIVVVLCRPDRVLTSSVQFRLQRSINKVRPDMIWLICSNARDPRMLSWIGETQKNGIELFLADWPIVAEFLETIGRPDRLAYFFAKLRVSMKAILVGGAQHAEQLEPAAYRSLAARTLPALAHVLDRTPRGQLVLDLGCGRGRHAIYALQSGLKVVAVERNPIPFADLASYVKASGYFESATQILGDYSQIDLRQFGYASVVIITGVLQHAKSFDELRQHLSILRKAACAPSTKIYIEMLFNILFDGQKPMDGRMDISPQEFNHELAIMFPEPEWKTVTVAGPIGKTQNFRGGPRSFYPPATTIELTVVEYLITHDG